ncbi:hypothetical protein BDA96_04G380500 [Sorghum bicolor]|uniref:Uncharacterized protein n=1 Tax=Sorghum bicolor TaxID=4558 RepID=A0A921R8G7_SORBI|nr:hypothetical protein BDA96_04G380500 [Sorghum bicolor]
MQVRPQLGKHQSTATPACDRDSHAQSENTDHGSGKIEDQRSWLSGHRLATIVEQLASHGTKQLAADLLNTSGGGLPKRVKKARERTETARMLKSFGS